MSFATLPTTPYSPVYDVFREFCRRVEEKNPWLLTMNIPVEGKSTTLKERLDAVFDTLYNLKKDLSSEKYQASLTSFSTQLRDTILLFVSFFRDSAKGMIKDVDNMKAKGLEDSFSILDFDRELSGFRKKCLLLFKNIVEHPENPPKEVEFVAREVFSDLNECFRDFNDLVRAIFLFSLEYTEFNSMPLSSPILRKYLEETQKEFATQTASKGSRRDALLLEDKRVPLLLKSRLAMFTSQAKGTGRRLSDPGAFSSKEQAPPVRHRRESDPLPPLQRQRR